MNSKSYAIGILSLTATVIATALLVAPTSTDARVQGVVVRDRDYTMISAPAGGGGDAIYIMDNRRGLMAVFTYDNSSRSLRLRAAAPVARAFPGSAPAPAPAPR